MNERLKKIFASELISLGIIMAVGFIIARYASAVAFYRYLAFAATIWLLFFVDAYYSYVASNKWPNRSKIFDIVAVVGMAVLVVGLVYLALSYLYPEYAHQYIDRIWPLAVGFVLGRIFIGRPGIR